MSTSELGCTYAALALYDDGIAINAEKIGLLMQAANISFDSYWPSLFAKLLEKKDIEDLILNAGAGGGAAPVAAVGGGGGAAPAAEEKKEEKKEEVKEESDDEIGFSLFDD